MQTIFLLLVIVLQFSYKEGDDMKNIIHEVMQNLEELGTEQTKKIYFNHGAEEPIFGVKIGDSKKLAKKYKNNHELGMELFATGNGDAIVLSQFLIDPKLLAKSDFESFMKFGKWYMISEYVIPNLAAESKYAEELVELWLESDVEYIKAAGYATYCNIISITPDHELNIDDIKAKLKYIKENIHNEQNRVRYVMNQFVISVGSFIVGLNDDALKIAKEIGKVSVNMGQTSCKVPVADKYIEKVVNKGYLGKKRKRCIC